MTMEDIDEGYKGLRAAASQITPPQSPKRNVVDEDISDEEEDLSRDALLRTNIEIVEKRLLDACHQVTLDSGIDKEPIPLPPAVVLPIYKPHAYPCQDTHKVLPSHPSEWPQSPVMLRPSPPPPTSSTSRCCSETKIRGIRYANSMEYQHFNGFCAGCILPINTGKEPEGASLVIDFESNLFVGTLLMRIRDAPPPPPSSFGPHGSRSNNKETAASGGATDYFRGKKRKFQALVKGKFKKALPVAQCVTGQTFDRPAGKLPAKWIVSSFIRFVSTLAPQLEVTIDGNHPRFLTPLAATAQTVMAKTTKDSAIDTTKTRTTKITEEQQDRLVNYTIYAGSQDIESSIEEPPARDETSLFQLLGGSQPDNAKSSVASRQKARKKSVNYLAAKNATEPCFELDKEYTFEFYQHLLLFGETLAVDMGRPIGKVPIAPITNGQPLKFMASHKGDDGDLQHLWSFDIWHESLYGYARQAYQTEK